MGLILYKSKVAKPTKREDGDDTSKLVSGYYSYGSSSSWQSGRWILFVLFIAAILIIILYTFLANRRRRSMGRAPIRGTAWLTPPSYRQSQSQQQYTGNVQQRTDDYVPEYTERANEHDLGYYDERGEFHPNDKAALVSPPPLVQELSSDLSNSLERPPAAVVHQTNTSDMDYDLARPSNGRVSEVNEAQELTPPERAKINTN